MFGTVQLADRSVVTEEEMILGPVLDTNCTQLKETQADSPVWIPRKVRGDSAGSTMDLYAERDINSKAFSPVAIKRSIFYDVVIV